MEDKPLSKNAQKRLLKAERFAALKAERRVRDKQKKKERIAKRRAEELDEDAPPAKRQKVLSHPKQVFGAKVVIDLGFDELMSEKEVVSLCSQLAYTYSSNRRSRNPFQSILCTSLDGKTLSRFQLLGSQYTRWHHVHFWETSYEGLWTTGEGESGGTHSCAKETVVYLTADSDEELTELKENETYIIGGICDHNRYKDLCLNKAKGQTLRHARLPIGTYLKHLPTRKVLTVNQVFDILLHWVEHRDWEKALYAVMPKRKFTPGKSHQDTEKSDSGWDVNKESETGADDSLGGTVRDDEPDLRLEDVNGEIQLNDEGELI